MSVTVDVDAGGSVTVDVDENAGGPAGGVLSGNYPDPGFAVPMATEAELTAHEAAHPAHPASGVSVASGAGVTATDVQAAIAQIVGFITSQEAGDSAAIAAVAAALADETTRATAQELLKLAKSANLSDVADAAAARTNLGLGSAATHPATDFDVAGAAAAAQAASQPLDSDLTAIAALSTTTFGRALLALADAAAGRTALGLGSAATQSSSAFDPAGAATAAAAALVNSSPATLDTLKELADALGDDPNFATTIATALGTKVDTAGVGLVKTGTTMRRAASTTGYANLAALPTASAHTGEQIRTTDGGIYESDGASWLVIRDPTGTYASDAGFYVVSKSAQTGAAINGEIANAVAAGKKHLVIPGGITWVLGAAGQIVIPSGITRITMEEGSTLLGPAGAYNGVTVGGTGLFAAVAGAGLARIVLEGITIDHQTNGTQGNGIELVPTSVTAGDFQGTPCSKVTVQGCDVAGYNAHEYLIWLIQAQYAKVLDNHVRGYGATGIDECGIEIAGGLDVLVQGNTVRECGQCGINLPDIIASNSRAAIKVVDNYVDTADYGIAINNGGSIDANATITGLIVERNQTRNTRSRGISFTTGAGVTVDDVRISRNQIHTPTGAGIGVVGNATTTATLIDINDNVIEGATAATSSDGAITVSTMPNVRIDRNRVRTGAANGIFLSTAADCEITRNRIENVQLSAVQAASADRLVVSHNVIHGYNITNASHPAIQVDTSADVIAEANATDKGTGTEYYSVYLTSGCTRGSIRGTKVLHQSALAPPTRNDGSNPNFATFTAPNDGSTTTLAITNTQLRTGMRVLIQQESGTPRTFRWVTSSSTLTVTWSAAPAGETYRYEILSH